MSIQTSSKMQVPDETKQVARAAFPKGNAYLTLRDELGTIYSDKQFEHLYSQRGRPAASPWRLAMVTIMQFGENLSDPQAADSVRSRIDWKYLLGLELSDPGFDFSVLSEFRKRLVEGGAETEMLNKLLGLFKQRGLLKGHRKQRTDSTYVLAAIRDLNRLECIHETMRKLLNILAQVAGDWLRARVPVEWYERYGARFDLYRLPKSKQDHKALGETIGMDGYQLMDWVFASDAPQEVRQQGAVEILRQIWVQNFYQCQGQVCWRETGNLPPGKLMIQSPHDLEVRYSRKRESEWKGYKVHLTEICEPDQPHFITNVETTSATTPDVAMTQKIQAALVEKGLPPSEHLLDTGYIDANHLVSSQGQGIDILGPVLSDSSWQAREGKGFDLTYFSIDWQQQVVTCPQGQTSRTWSKSHDELQRTVIHIRFARKDCQACSVRSLCTTAKKNARSLKLRPQLQHEACQKARERQKNFQFWENYRLRSGVEGTLSQAIRRSGLRRTRYVGQAKTHLQMVFTALAINLARFVAWTNQEPFASTRINPFSSLAPT